MNAEELRELQNQAWNERTRRQRLYVTRLLYTISEGAKSAASRGRSGVRVPLSPELVKELGWCSGARLSSVDELPWGLAEGCRQMVDEGFTVTLDVHTTRGGDVVLSLLARWSEGGEIANLSVPRHISRADDIENA